MMITLKEKESALQLKQQEQAAKLQETQQAAQIQLMKMQTDATAAMHEVVQKIMNKSPLDKYKEQKAAIAAMLAAEDIPDHFAAQLMEKLNAELLGATLI
jgi:glutamate/tyrosine decarboxylase-like PLP-dependent enzyme